MKNTAEKITVLTYHEFLDLTARRATLGTLKRIYCASGDEKVRQLWNGLIADFKAIDNNTLVSFSDGYDCYCVVYEYLHNEYCKGNNVDTLETRQRKKSGMYDDGDGNKVYCTPIAIKTKFAWSCSTLRQYIYKHGQTDYKRTYVKELNGIEEEGKEEHKSIETYIKIPLYYDLNTLADWEFYQEFSGKVFEGLTARQKSIVHYRMQGLSVNEISEKLGVKQNTISSHLATIQNKVNKLYPEMVTHFKKKRTRKIKENATA